MNKIINIFENLITLNDEYEWLDFKEYKKYLDDKELTELVNKYLKKLNKA